MKFYLEYFDQCRYNFTFDYKDKEYVMNFDINGEEDFYMLRVSIMKRYTKTTVYATSHIRTKDIDIESLLLIAKDCFNEFVEEPVII